MFLFEFDYVENVSLPLDVTIARKNIKVDKIFPPWLMRGLRRVSA